MLLSAEEVCKAKEQNNSVAWRELRDRTLQALEDICLIEDPDIEERTRIQKAIGTVNTFSDLSLLAPSEALVYLARLSAKLEELERTDS